MRSARVLSCGVSAVLLAVACGGGGSGPPAVTPAAGPSAPGDLRVTQTAPIAVELTWVDNASDEDGFRVERRLPGQSTFEQLAQVPADQTALTDTPLDRGATYAYRVRAFNGNGNSDYSNVAEIRVRTPLTLADANPDSGFTTGATQVTLRGSGFTEPGAEPNTVLFGGVMALDVTTRSDDDIDALAPASSPGSVDVMVSNRNGVAVLPGGFTHHTWPPALLLEDRRLDTDAPGTADSTQVQTCCTRSNVYVVWRDDRDDGGDIYFNRSVDRGMTFETVDTRIDSAPRGAVSARPQITCVLDAVYVVWQDNRNGNDDIYFNVSLDQGATFRPQDTRINTDPMGAAAARHPQIDHHGADWVIAVWEDDRHGIHSIHCNVSFDRGSSWARRDIRVDRPAGGGPLRLGATAPRICSRGLPTHVVWQDDRNGTTDIYYNRTWNGGAAWLPEDTRLNTHPPGLVDAQNPHLTCDGERVFVAWEDFRNGGSDIYLNRSLNGGNSFLPADVRLDTDAPGAANSSDVHLCLDGDLLCAVWEDDRGTGGRDEIRFTRSTDQGRTFLTADVRLDTDNDPTRDSDSPRISCSRGNVFVAWDRGSANDCNIFLSSSPDAGLTFQSQVLRVDRGSADADRPRLCSVGARGYVVWQDNRHGNDDIYFNHNLPAAPTPGTR